MDTIDGEGNALVERIYGYVLAHGNKTNSDTKIESDDASSRTISIEARVLEMDDAIITASQKVKSGVSKGDAPKSYRVVSKTFQYVSASDGADVIARQLVAEGNWFPNPYIPEQSESSMCLSKATGPVWVFEGDSDAPALRALLDLLVARYDQKTA